MKKTWKVRSALVFLCAALLLVSCCGVAVPAAKAEDALSAFTVSSIRIAKDEENHVRFTNDFREVDVSYAWYVVKDGEVIYKRMYENYSTFDYDFTEPGSYFLVAYVKMKDQDVRKQIRTDAFAVTQNGILVFAPDQQVESLQDQEVTEFIPYCVRFKLTKERHIRFINEYDYTDVSYAWYVFQDGEAICKRMYEEGNTFDYDFTDPGSYTLTAFIRTNDENKEVKAIANVAVVTVLQDGTITCEMKK